MAKPTPDGSKGFFQNLWDQIHSWIAWAESLFQAVVNQVEFIQTLKGIVTDDFQELIDQLKELTDEQADFKDRLKNLRKHVIRADVIFEFIDEIRTGELRDFLVNQLGSLKSSLSETIEQIEQTAAAVGATKSAGNALLNWIGKIATVWTAIAQIVHTLKGIVPVVQALKAKLTEFESVILTQDKPRLRVKDPGYHYSRRG